MFNYEEKAKHELALWQTKMCQSPSLASLLSKGVQDKINRLIPEKVHHIITEAIKNMVRAVLVGSEFTSISPLANKTLEEREKLVRKKIDSYRKLGAASGIWTGTGGFLLALADFPLLLSLQMKLLFDIASLYGYPVREYKERLYILYIFQLTFFCQDKRTGVYQQVLNWDQTVKSLPNDIHAFDWRTFQLEYRDYIDLAKLLQMIPGIGAVVGAYANHQLIDKLGETAINAYRLRLFTKPVNTIDPIPLKVIP